MLIKFRGQKRRMLAMNEELTRMIEPEIQKIKVFQRIAAIFLSPGELMKNVKSYPIIGVPIALCIVLNVLFIPINLQLTELMGLAGQMPIDEYGDTFQGIAEITLIVTAIGQALVGPLFIGALAAVILWVLSKIVGGKASFSQILSMSMHILVLSYVGSLISGSLMVSTGSLTDMTSLAALIMPHGDMSMPMFNLLSSISVFSVWATILTFLGIKIINDLSGVRAGVITCIYFAGNIAVSVILLALASLML